MKKKFKKIPKFESEDAERDFWAVNDSTDYIDWGSAIKNPQLPNLKLSTKTISIRMPVSMLNSLKMAANKRDVPYQSLAKMYLHDALETA